MTYEKWMEEMAKKMAMEMLFPANDEHSMSLAHDKMKDFSDEDQEEE